MAQHTDASNGTNRIDNEMDISSDDVLEVELDLEKLSALVRTNPTLLGGEDVAQLLERLSNAENMADGIESKIDNVLENLDNLLAALEGADPQSKGVKDEVNEEEGFANGDAKSSS